MKEKMRKNSRSKIIVACNTWLVDRCYCHIGNHGDVNLDDFREK